MTEEAELPDLGQTGYPVWLRLLGSSVARTTFSFRRRASAPALGDNLGSISLSGCFFSAL